MHGCTGRQLLKQKEVLRAHYDATREHNEQLMHMCEQEAELLSAKAKKLGVRYQSCEAQLVNINNKLVLFQQSQQQHSHEVDVQMKRINGHKEHINEQLKTTQVAKPSCFVCGLKFVCAPMTVRTELCLCLCVLKCSWDGSFISNRFKIIISRHF